MKKMKKMAAKTLAAFVENFRQIAGRAEYIAQKQVEAERKNGEAVFIQFFDMTEHAVQVEATIRGDSGRRIKYVRVSWEELFALEADEVTGLTKAEKLKKVAPYWFTCKDLGIDIPGKQEILLQLIPAWNLGFPAEEVYSLIVELEAEANR